MARRRREPSHRKTAGDPTTARRPGPDALTLDQIREAIRESVIEYHDGKAYPKQQEAVERRRDAIRQGDLLALFSAVEQCSRPTRHGFSHEDVSLNPELQQKMLVCEVPAWLLGEISMLLWQGIGGEWPSARGRSAPGRRTIDAQRDLWRAWHVVKARQDGVSWDDVFKFVSKKAKGRAGAANTVEKAYLRVAEKIRTDPDFYRRTVVVNPRILDAAVAPPERSKKQ